MMSKRTNKVVTSVIENIVLAVSSKYNINIRELAESVPKSLECEYILTKGKRRGKKCGVVLCDRHKKEHIWPEIYAPEFVYKGKEDNNIIDTYD